MPAFVILSRISPGAFDDPKDFKALAKDVSEKIKRECPGVTWKESFATLGRFDVVDIVEAADLKEVEKGDDYPRLRACIHRDAGCNALEGISRGSVAYMVSHPRARGILLPTQGCPQNSSFRG